MLENPSKLKITFRAFPLVGWFVFFSTYRVNEDVRSYRVDIGAVGAEPCNGNPRSSCINGFVLVESYCFRFAFWTFFFDVVHHQLCYTLYYLNHYLVLIYSLKNGTRQHKRY